MSRREPDINLVRQFLGDDDVLSAAQSGRIRQRVLSRIVAPPAQRTRFGTRFGRLGGHGRLGWPARLGLGNRVTGVRAIFGGGPLVGGRLAGVAATTAVIAAIASASMVLGVGPLAGTSNNRASEAGTALAAALAAAEDLDLPATIAMLVRDSENAQPVRLDGQRYVYSRTTAEALEVIPTNAVPVQGEPTSAASNPAAPASGTPTPDTSVARSGQVRITSRIERWTPVTGGPPVRVKTTTGLRRVPVSEADRALLEAAGYDFAAPPTVTDTATGAPPPLDRQGRQPGGAMERVGPTPAYLDGLPKTADQILTRFRADFGADSYVFKEITYLLENADALLTPALRAALFQALGALPGVIRVPGSVDLAGRVGVALAFPDEKLQQEIIVEPGSSRVLGTRLVQGSAGTRSKPGDATQVQPAVDAGTVWRWSTCEQSLTDTVGQG